MDWNDSSTWKHDSAKFDWVGRSEAWDIQQLLAVGERLSSKLFCYMELLAEVGIDALRGVRPKNIKTALQIFEVLAGHAPQRQLASAIDAGSYPGQAPSTNAAKRHTPPHAGGR